MNALINDKIHTLLRNKVVQTLEQENPGAEITQKFNTFSNYKILEKNADEYAEQLGKRTL